MDVAVHQLGVHFAPPSLHPSRELPRRSIWSACWHCPETENTSKGKSLIIIASSYCGLISDMQVWYQVSDFTKHLYTFPSGLGLQLRISQDRMDSGHAHICRVTHVASKRSFLLATVCQTHLSSPPTLCKHEWLFSRDISFPIFQKS